MTNFLKNAITVDQVKLSGRKAMRTPRTLPPGKGGCGKPQRQREKTAENTSTVWRRKLQHARYKRV